MMSPATVTASPVPALDFLPKRMLLVGLILCFFSSAQASSVRLLRVVGPLPARYLTQIAAFGNPLDGSDGNPVERTYNLMLPTENPWLCEFPSIFSDSNANETAAMKKENARLYPTPVALFVSINSCSAEQKAKVALEIKEKLVPSLELLLIYSPDPRKNNLITLQPNDPNAMRNRDMYGSIALSFIPYQYAAGVETRMRMAWSGSDPRLLLYDNAEWTFPIQLANYTGARSDDDVPNSGSSNRSGLYDDDGSTGNQYWFRIILFSILVMTPCCRACYLWYAGGGRFYFRRGANGRIIGLQYVPAAPAWLAAGRMGAGNGGGNAADRTRSDVLTEEQFNTLPEIEYKPVASHYDEDNEDDEDAGSVKKEAETDNTAAQDNGGDIETGSTTDSTSGVSSVPEAVPSDCEASTSAGAEENKARPPNDTEATSEADNTEDEKQKDETVAEKDSADAARESSDERAKNEPLICRSTMCSVCIDDFEAGEKIILLPRCQHGFHRDCIHPWLTERQGCCPFCKTGVLSDAADGVDEEEGGGGDGDASGSRGDDEPSAEVSSNEAPAVEDNSAGEFGSGRDPPGAEPEIPVPRDEIAEASSNEPTPASSAEVQHSRQEIAAEASSNEPSPSSSTEVQHSDAEDAPEDGRQPQS